MKRMGIWSVATAGVVTATVCAAWTQENTTTRDMLASDIVSTTGHATEARDTQADEVRMALLSEFTFTRSEETAERMLALANELNDPDDPAYDSYREARQELTRARYRRALRMMERIHERHPRSGYADDALYWSAFAYYRLAERDDDRRDYQRALERLELLKSDYSTSDALADADELMARIQGRLAELGDAPSAARVRERADRDVDDEMRLIALDALLQMDSDDAFPILRRLLIDNRERNEAKIREKAVFILSQNSSDETTDILLDVARNDPDREVRLQAVFWLSQVDDRRAVEALIDVLADADDEELQEKAIFALSQHDSEDAARALRGYATDRDKPDELREHAIFWLGQHDSAHNFQFLSDLYGDLRSPELKEKVIFAMAQQDARRNRDWLLQRVKDRDEGNEMRKQALFWLGQQGHIPCSELGDLVHEFDDEEILEQLTFVLGQRKEDACVDALIAIARSTQNTELRKNAVFWLGQTRNPRALRFLEELIEQ